MLGEYFLPVPPENEDDGGDEEEYGDGEHADDDPDVGLVLVVHHLLCEKGIKISIPTCEQSSRECSA